MLLAVGLDSRAYRLDWAPGTTIFELDQPQVLEFRRETLAAHGAAPKAERREVAVDLRDDWPQALRDSGFRPDEPSAWIAEGLLIYLPASAQEQLFTGIDSLAASGSHVAIEEGRPMDDDAFQAKREEGKDIADHRGEWWQMIYNEQHAPAAQWFSERGWTATETALSDYLVVERTRGACGRRRGQDGRQRAAGQRRQELTRISGRVVPHQRTQEPVDAAQVLRLADVQDVVAREPVQRTAIPVFPQRLGLFGRGQAIAEAGDDQPAVLGHQRLVVQRRSGRPMRRRSPRG